eukprot:UN09867
MSLVEEYPISPAVHQYFQRNAAYDGGIASDSEQFQDESNNNSNNTNNSNDNNNTNTTPSTTQNQQLVANAYGVYIKPNPIY